MISCKPSRSSCIEAVMMDDQRLSLSRRRCMPLVQLIGIAFAVIMFQTSACAEVSVQADASAVQIVAKQSPLGSVLDAMAAQLPIRYEARTGLQSTVTGTFNGHLDQVLGRLLQGYNYVITSRGPTIKVIILGKSDMPSVTAGTTPSIVPPTSTSPAAQNTNPAVYWRTPPPQKP
jgi:hypothetical protein